MGLPFYRKKCKDFVGHKVRMKQQKNQIYARPLHGRAFPNWHPWSPTSIHACVRHFGMYPDSMPIDGIHLFFTSDGCPSLMPSNSRLENSPVPSFVIVAAFFQKRQLVKRKSFRHSNNQGPKYIVGGHHRLRLF